MGKSLVFLMCLALPLASQARVNVVSTTSDLAYFASVVGGDAVEATSILKGYQDPHFAAAKPSYMLAVSRADLVLAVGMDLEIGWLPSILQGARNPSVMPGGNGYLDCSRFISPIEVPAGGADRSQGDLHPQGNPHWWLSATEARKVARGIEARLELLSPADAATFQHGLVRLLSEIDAAETEARALLTGFHAPPLVTFHVTFSYFFGLFGLKPAAFIEPKPGLPPSPSHVASLVAELTGRSPLFLVEPYYDADVARDLASRTGGRVVVVPSAIGGTDGARTYRDLLRTIARAVRGE